MTQSAAQLGDNPFFLLGADYKSSASDLSDLVEDAEFDGKFSSEILHRAQQALVTPRTRLMAELSWLPELSDAQVNKTFTLLNVNGGVKFGHCGGAKVGQFGASALERAALI